MTERIADTSVDEAAVGRPAGAVALEGLRVHAIDTACCALFTLLEEGGDDGLVWSETSREADVLMVAGPVNAKLASDIRAAYEAMPRPRAVVAIGSCALDGSAFRHYPNVLPGVDGVIPVDVRVTGCPPDAGAVRSALAEAAASLRGEGRRAAGSG